MIIFRCSSLSVGTVSGYQLFAVSSVESLDKIFESGMVYFFYIHSNAL